MKQQFKLLCCKERGPGLSPFPDVGAPILCLFSSYNIIFFFFCCSTSTTTRPSRATVVHYTHNSKILRCTLSSTGPLRHRKLASGFSYTLPWKFFPPKNGRVRTSRYNVHRAMRSRGHRQKKHPTTLCLLPEAPAVL